MSKRIRRDQTWRRGRRGAKPLLEDGGGEEAGCAPGDDPGRGVHEPGEPPVPTRLRRKWLGGACRRLGPIVRRRGGPPEEALPELAPDPAAITLVRRHGRKRDKPQITEPQCLRSGGGEEGKKGFRLRAGDGEGRSEVEEKGGGDGRERRTAENRVRRRMRCTWCDGLTNVYQRHAQVHLAYSHWEIVLGARKRETKIKETPNQRSSGLVYEI